MQEVSSYMPAGDDSSNHDDDDDDDGGGGWCKVITLDMKDLDAHVDYGGVLILFLSCRV